MNDSNVLQWHYLVFIVPAGASAFLLLLSGLRFGGHRSHHAGGHSGRHIGGAGTARHGPSHSGNASRHGTATKHGIKGAGATRRHSTATSGNPMHGLADFILAVLGIGRMPWLLLGEMFFLCGGVAGFWANRLLLANTPMPSVWQWLPSLYIALIIGFIGARLVAELIVRMMPKEESAIVGRDGLFGLVGKVVYPVGESAGRVHIYDPYGTLHDEACRIAPGKLPIEKGSYARIIDRDVEGRFVVEEAPEPVHFP